jgi:hypothetical protein
LVVSETRQKAHIPIRNPSIIAKNAIARDWRKLLTP